ncbi:50S ribosomal protein L23, partial [Akkermansia sp.]
MKDIYQVIKKVRISEKATMLQETTGELVFEVDRDANKIEIKKAVEVAFGKKVASVRT